LLGVPKATPGSSLAVQTKAKASSRAYPRLPGNLLIVMPANAGISLFFSVEEEQ
jgi:hypothetical protein